MKEANGFRAALEALKDLAGRAGIARVDLEVGPEGSGLAAYFEGGKRALDAGDRRGERGPWVFLALGLREEAFGEGVATLFLKGELYLRALPLVRGGLSQGSPVVLLEAKDVRKMAKLLARLLRAFALLREDLPGAGKRKRFLEETEERLSKLASLLKEAASGKTSGRAVPFGFFSKGGEAMLWNEEEHPFPELLALLPEGGLYRGPVPGRPGVELDGLVLPGSRASEARFLPKELAVGGRRFRPGDEEGLYLFAYADATPQRVLLRFPGVDAEADALLREGKLEEAARRISLNRVAGV